MINNKDENKVNYFFVFFIIVLMFRPSPTLLLGPVIGLRMMDLILLIFLLVYIFYKRSESYKIDNTTLILMIMLVSQCISMFFSIFYHEVLIEDLFEIFRPVLYVVTYIVIKKYYTFTSLNYVYTAIFFTLLLGFIELHNFFNLENVLKYLYDHTKSRAIDSTSWRIVGSFYNPNYFGYYLALIVNLSLIMVLFQVRTKYSLFIFSFSLYLLFFTGSRTALISVGVGLLITIVLYLLKHTGIKVYKKLIILFCILSFTLFIAPNIIEYLNQNFKRFNDFENISHNFYTRVAVWDYSLQWIKERPLFGNGPGKAIIESFDNNYIIILFRYGIVGLIIFLLLLVKLYIRAFSNFFKSNNMNITIASLVIISVLNILNVTMLTAIPFDFIQTGTLFICCIAIYNALVGSISNEK